MWISLALKFLGGGLMRGLAALGGAIKALIAWAWHNPAQALCLALAGVVFWQYSGKIEAQAEASANLALYQEEKLAHRGTVESYFLARKVAAELDRQNAARAKADFENQLLEINHENSVLQRANRDLVSERLRQPARSASVDSGSGGKTLLPVLSEMPAGALPATGAAIISEADALICSDNFGQLTGIIAAWKAASAINTNGESE
jgi:hypothetical protein